jgi:single-strand DNA-binding protein
VNEPHITLAGNLAHDPTLRTTGNNHAVTNLRVATTPRLKKAEEWVDGETLWFDVVCWKQLAENAAQSLHRGDPVTVEGRLYSRSWKREDGTEVTQLTVDATHVGVDLSRYQATVQKPVRSFPEDALPDRWVDKQTGEIVTPVEDEQAA